MTLNTDKTVWHSWWSMCGFLSCHVNTLLAAWKQKRSLKITTCAKISWSRLWSITCSQMTSGLRCSHPERAPGLRLAYPKLCTLWEARHLKQFEGNLCSFRPCSAWTDLAWRNSWHFATPILVSPQKRRLKNERRISILISRALWEICFS